MPTWCVQDNECLACLGGCYGYETKRTKMREIRAKFWRTVSNEEETVMDQITAARNANKELFTTYDDDLGSVVRVHVTDCAGLGINVVGHVIVMSPKAWHTLACDDAKRKEEFAVQEKNDKASAEKALAVYDWLDKVGSSGSPVLDKPPTFAQKLKALLNGASKENGSNTPDFVLAEYLTNCLGNFEAATKAREKFYGVSSRPGSGIGGTPARVTITKMEHEHVHAIEINETQACTATLQYPIP